MNFRVPLVCALTLAVFSGCGGTVPVGRIDEGGGGSGGDGQGGSGGDGPTVPDLAPGWNEFNPPNTICSRGTPYAYWVRPGTVNKVVIDFIGGGACWDEFTCSVADAIFEPDVESVRQAVADDTPNGIYDHANPDNPFADWYHVIVPYCTGDVHWGNAVTTYGSPPDEVTINHKGAVNTRAVLDWVYAGFSKPEQVLVTGCSAGSYGSSLWAAHIMQHYQQSEVFQFGDSGAGIITQDFFQNSFPSWNAVEAFPAFIPALDPAQVDIQMMALPDLYIGIANHFSTQRLSQYNTWLDENQTFFYTAMGGMGGAMAWSTQMQASIAEIEAGATNFSSFTAPGEQHCIIPYDNFYTVQANGVRLVDWLRSMIEKTSFESVACQGGPMGEAECMNPTP